MVKEEGPVANKIESGPPGVVAFKLISLVSKLKFEVAENPFAKACSKSSSRETFGSLETELDLNWSMTY